MPLHMPGQTGTPPEANGVLIWSHYYYYFQLADNYSWSDNVAEIPWDSYNVNHLASGDMKKIHNYKRQIGTITMASWFHILPKGVEV